MRTLRERLEETVESYFGAIVMRVVREALLDKIEQDVKDWLLDYKGEIINDNV